MYVCMNSKYSMYTYILGTGPVKSLGIFSNCLRKDGKGSSTGYIR